MGIASWLDIFLPPTQLSGDAAARLTDWQASRPDEYCGRCGSSVSFAAITESGCPHCRGVRIAWHGLWRLGAYEPPLSRWVVDCKFHRAWGWGEWFGQQLAARTPNFDGAIVVPVPLHWRRRAGRGYDQSRLIATAFAQSKGLAVLPLLRRARATRQQSLLHAQERRKTNVRRAFTLRSGMDLTNRTLWLIDDVKTSGATLHACTRLLQHAGAERVNVAVAAVADPKGADFQRS